jgi:hypothetical protein
MTLPAGIITKTLAVSSGVGMQGSEASLEVLVIPESPHSDAIVWAATNEPVVSFFTLTRTLPGVSAAIRLPAVDQPGFIDSNQLPLTDWYYKITVRYLVDGRKVGVSTTKYIKPYVTDQNVTDFDLIPSGDAPLYRGPTGLQGKSAYDIAVEYGFEGTVEEWLTSLSVSIPGPPGIVEVYEHVQSIPEKIWVIHHNLGRKVAGVSLVDSSKRVFMAEWEFTDLNTVTVYMTGAQSGYAYVL